MKFDNSKEMLEFFQNIMKNTFEEETNGQETIDFTTVQGKFLTSILNSLALYGYGLQDNLYNNVMKQQFVSTANSYYLRYIHGNEQNLAPIEASSSEGYIIVCGEVGATVPANIEFYKGGNNYVSQDNLSYIKEVALSYSSIVEQQGKIIVTLQQDYELATGLTMKSINGAYTATDKKIIALSTNSFSFDKVQGQLINGETGNVVFDISKVFVKCNQTGESTNQENGTELKLLNAVSNLKDVAFVSFSGLNGGVEAQSDEEFRNTLLYIKRNIPQGWTEAKIDFLIKTYGNFRYFYDLIYTPRTQTVDGYKTVGYTTTYLLKKSLAFFSNTEKTLLKNYLLQYYDIKDDNNYFNIVDPVKKTINISVKRLNTKVTIDMKNAIIEAMKNFQMNSDYCWFAKKVLISDIKDYLKNVVDINGIVLGNDFNLLNPNLDIALTYNQFPIIEVEVL